MKTAAPKNRRIVVSLPTACQFKILRRLMKPRPVRPRPKLARVVGSGMSGMLRRGGNGVVINNIVNQMRDVNMGGGHRQLSIGLIPRGFARLLLR